jgi:hypothetical protein
MMPTCISSMWSCFAGAWSLILLLPLAFVHADTIKPNEPQMLDLSGVCTNLLTSPEFMNQAFKDFVGEQQLDGLPFDVRRHGVLHGQKEANASDKTEKDYPDFLGIKVGRPFEELHLLHTARWSHVEGEPIALVRLHFADGSEKLLPIRYGVHLRDWQHLFSEATEALEDPHSKLVWRGRTLAEVSTSTRLFKSRLLNPDPEKEVTTIDFLSTKSLAAYNLYAATVANADDQRPVTPPVKAETTEHKFDGTCTITVLDADTEKPLPRALIDPGMSLDNLGAIATPVRTDAQGQAVIPFPRGHLDYHYGRVALKNYSQDYISGEGDFPDQVTVRLRREE